MIYLAADHRGFKLKEKIKSWLKHWNREFTDCGNTVYDEADDYPDFAAKAAKRLENGSQDDRGIVLCGSGIGVSIAANRFSGVRCALGFDDSQVKHGVASDHINALALPADYIDDEKAKELVKIFLESKPKEEEKFKRRIEKLERL